MSRKTQFNRCGNYTSHTPHEWPSTIDSPLFYCDGREGEIDQRMDETLHEGNQPIDVGAFRLPMNDRPDPFRPKLGPPPSIDDTLDLPRPKWEQPEYDPCADCGKLHPGSGRDCWRYNPVTADGTEPGDWPQDEPDAQTTDIVRWADRAMFQAEPIDTEKGPQVYLLWMTPDPLGAIAAACKMYKGEVVRDLSTVTDDERLEYFEQVQKTKLKAPFEFVKFHFMIEGVTRAFTHQMVRQRTAVYAQESLRFAVLGAEDGSIPVALPPSLSGLPNDDPRIQAWAQATSEIEGAYHDLIDNGVPAEDARGLLPHNVLTRLHYSTDLRALLDHAGNRLCTQAQFEWRLVWARIIEAIRGKAYGRVDANGTDRVYMADQLAALFKPVCYQTGKCEFKANFDRACSIRDRVDTNEQIGRPSSEWHKSTPHGAIEAIKPGEWLLDPGAARRRR